MSKSNKRVGFILLFLSAAFLCVLNIMTMLNVLTSYDIVIVREINNIVNWFYNIMGRLYNLNLVLLFVGLYFVSRIILKDMKIFHIFSAVMAVFTLLVFVNGQFRIITNEDVIIALYKTRSYLEPLYFLTFIILIWIFNPNYRFALLLTIAFLLRVIQIPFLLKVFNKLNLQQNIGLSLNGIFLLISYILLANYAAKELARL